MARSAFEEAIRHLSQGVSLLAAQPGGGEDARELPLQFALAGAVVAARGYAHPEVEATYERALVLCEAVGDAVGLGWSLAGLAMFAQQSGQAERAAALATRVLGIAEDVSDADLALRGHLDLAAAEERVRACAERFALRVDPRSRVEDLSIAARQRLAILSLQGIDFRALAASSLADGDNPFVIFIE